MDTDDRVLSMSWEDSGMSYTLKVQDGDLVTDTANKYVVISKLEKCAQDIMESLLNNWDEDSDQYYNGSTLYIVEQHPTRFDVIGAEEFIRSAVEDSIERLQNSQDEDDFVDEEEKIEEVAELTVWRDDDAKTSWNFFLRVLTESENFVPMSFEVTAEQQLPSGVTNPLPRDFQPSTLDFGSSFK